MNFNSNVFCFFFLVKSFAICNSILSLLRPAVFVFYTIHFIWFISWLDDGISFALWNAIICITITMNCFCLVWIIVNMNRFMCLCAYQHVFAFYFRAFDSFVSRDIYVYHRYESLSMTHQRRPYSWNSFDTNSNWRWTTAAMAATLDTLGCFKKW